MADDFTGRFQYGLNNLPMEPPDDFNALYSPYGFTSTGMQRLPEPQSISAGFGFPGLRRAPVGLFPAPESPNPQNPVPGLSDWWRMLGAGLQLYPMVASGLGSRRRSAVGVSRNRRRSDDDEWCYQRHEAEDEECNARDPKWIGGCKERAAERRNRCVQSGGRPPWDEPLKWGPEDEKVEYRQDLSDKLK